MYAVIILFTLVLTRSFHSSCFICSSILEIKFFVVVWACIVIVDIKEVNCTAVVVGTFSDLDGLAGGPDSGEFGRLRSVVDFICQFLGVAEVVAA